MSEWNGFPTFERGTLTVSPDYGAPDDDPTPLVALRQPGYPMDDLINLTEADLRWLVEVVAPVVLKRMGERP